jgi:hypothetical protein
MSRIKSSKVIAFLFFIFVISCSSKPTETRIVVPDKSNTNNKMNSVTENSAIEEPLVIGGYTFGEYYSKESIKNVSDFDLFIGPNRCANFDGIEQLENIDSLYLSIMNEDVPDLTPLQNLTKLKSFGIYANINKISSLSFIGGGLEILGIYSARLESLEGLEKMQSLKSLYIAENQVPITNTKALRYLRNLISLGFANGIYSINLKDLVDLKTLRFKGCGAIDLNDIKHLQSLERLVLLSNTDRIINEKSEYVNLEKIGDLVNLKEIYLDETINSIDFLANNINLERIILVADEERDDFVWSEPVLLDVEPLQNLTKLTFLRTRGFVLKNLDMLANLDKLEYIDTNIGDSR